MTQALVRPGGRKPLDITDKDTLDTLTNLTSYAMDTIAERRMSENKVVDIQTKAKQLKYQAKVLKAESQIVAGVNYYLTVRMNDAECSQQCSIEECNLVIWVKAWENFRNLTSFNCNQVKPEGSLLVGAVNDLNVSSEMKLDDNSQAALDVVLARINRALDSVYYHKVNSISQAKRQVVAGNSYRFEFTMGETTCKKSETITNLSECKLSGASKPLRCNASILDKAWARVRYSNVKFNCKNE